MIAPLRTLLLISAIALAGLAAARTGFIQLTTIQTASVADGRSTIEVKANVLETSGKPVPDDTEVLFTTTLGDFRQPVALTRQGVARATLRAGSVPGMAKITATAVTYNATTSIDFLFVSDRSMLSTAKEFIEVTAPTYLVFNPDLNQRVLEATGPNRGVKLRYREVEIEADDLQLDIPNYEVRARRARLRMGKIDQNFDELNLKLLSRSGSGITTYVAPQVDKVIPVSNGFVWKYVEARRSGLASFDSNGVRSPDANADVSLFEFQDLSLAASLIGADRAIVFPRREIQFQRAEIFVSGRRVMKMPMYAFSMNTASPLVTDNIINVNDNQIALNYPYFLSLRPGQSSMLRVRTGQSYGRGGGAVRGLFLDYELAWNRGDEMSGALTYSGIGRDDWSLGFNQFAQLDSRTEGNISVELPASRSLFGSLNLRRRFNGFDASLWGNATRSLRGQGPESQQFQLSLDKEPMKVRGLPVRLNFGVSLVQEEIGSRFASGNQSYTALRAGATFLAQRIDRDTSINGEIGFQRRFGSNVRQPYALSAFTSLRRQLGPDANITVTYNFRDDGFSSRFLGKHRVGFRAGYERGRTSLDFSQNRSIDRDQTSTQADVNYFMGGPWRLSYQYTFDRYLGDSFLDYTAILKYRLGFRDLGLTWSRRTKRFGIQILDASFD